MGEPTSSQNSSVKRIAAFEFTSSPRLQLGIILALAITIMFSKLGGNGLANYDDCFYAQKAKEILHTGDWTTMHFNKQPAWENPPFFMWLIVLSYTMFGITEFAAKFPSAFFGVATIFLVYLIAKRLYDTWTAFFSSFVLTTTFIFTRYARHAMMDVTLSFFVCLSLYAVLLALEKHRLYFILWGLCGAICILIKSVLGFYPMLITVVFLLLTSRWRMLFDRHFLAGTVLMLGVGCSWYIDQYLRFGQQFIDAHFGWVIVTRGFNVEQQAWYEHLTYVQDLATYYWPWFPVFIIGLAVFVRRALRRDTIAVLMVLWSCLIVVIMSMMQSRVLWYIMPMFPAAAIMCGNTLSVLLREQGKTVAVKIIFVLTVVTMIVLNATPVSLESDRERDVREIAPYVRHVADNGAHVIAFRQDYYGLNNALLFYSDAAAYPLYQDYISLSQALKNDTLIVCILKVGDLAELNNYDLHLAVVKKTDELVLVANQAINFNSVIRQ